MIKIRIGTFLILITLTMSSFSQIHLDLNKKISNENKILLRKKTKKINAMGVFLPLERKLRIIKIELNEREGFFDLLLAYNNEVEIEMKNKLFNDLLYYGIYDVFINNKRTKTTYIFSYNIIFNLVEIYQFQDNTIDPKIIYLKNTHND